MIGLRHVFKTYKGKNEVEALKDIDLTVEEGDIFGVVGFSGAGKSTLIRMVNALEKPTSGQVFVGDQELGQLSEKELRKVRKGIGMIFQQFNLLESKTVYENVAIPLILNGYPKKKLPQRVEELLDYVSLGERKNAYPSQLSGGQKQRVGIARALANSPKILLCDEATSALDPNTTESILSLLKKINRELAITILIITHEMNVIRDICNKVAVMEKGHIVEQGSVLDVFGHPKDPVTQSFVRTVINDTLPLSIADGLRKECAKYPVLRLRFFGNNTREAILSHISKKFEVEVNILFASVNELQGEILGILIIQLVGEPKEREKVYAYFDQNSLGYEEVSL